MANSTFDHVLLCSNAQRKTKEDSSPVDSAGELIVCLFFFLGIHSSWLGHETALDISAQEILNQRGTLGHAPFHLQ